MRSYGFTAVSPTLTLTRTLADVSSARGIMIPGKSPGRSLEEARGRVLSARGADRMDLSHPVDPAGPLVGAIPFRVVIPEGSAARPHQKCPSRRSSELQFVSRPRLRIAGCRVANHPIVAGCPSRRLSELPAVRVARRLAASRAAPRRPLPAHCSEPGRGIRAWPRAAARHAAPPAQRFKFDRADEAMRVSPPGG